MVTKSSFLSLVLVSFILCSTVPAEGVDLKRNGAFGFPQAQSRVLCDTEILRVSAWSNAEHLYVQAIVWTDDNEEEGEVASGQTYNDYSNLFFDIDGDKLRTRLVDRSYYLNFPGAVGLYNSIVMAETGATAGRRELSSGRGLIKYVENSDGKKVRVDNFLIPLTEVEKNIGDAIRFSYWTRSPQPEFTANSIGFESQTQYFPQSLPVDKFHEFTFTDGGPLDVTALPVDARLSDSTDTVPVGPTATTPAPTLTIGSRAPALDVEHWVQNGQGKFPPVTEFAPGKVYIVEFWATWCGPCIAAMPHIADLQKTYVDQGLQVVSISDEKLEVVEKFLERKTPASTNQEPITYRELTSTYCLTTDPDRSNHDNYMKAAGQNGIPTAFIVGKDGFVEWIGHPMSIDKALVSVIEGVWNREAYAAEFREKDEFSRKVSGIMSLAFNGKHDAAIKAANDARDAATADAIKKIADNLVRTVRRIEVEKHILMNSSEAVAKLEVFLDGQTPSEINNVVWELVVTLKEKGRNIRQEILASALQLTEKAVNVEPEYGNLLDTHAHLLQLNGKLDQAIEVQQKAVKHADAESRVNMESYLEKLRTLKDPQSAKKTPDETVSELRRFDGHSDKATFVSFSPDGKLLLSSSDDKTVRLWDVASGKELKSFQGHESMALCAVFAPDGKRFMTSSGWPPKSGDDSIRYWDLESGREIWKGTGHKDSIWKVSISSDGKRALTASRDANIGLWDVESGQLLKTLTGHTNWVRQAVFVPNQDLAVSASWDQTIRIWDLASGKQVRQIDSHQAQVQDVAVSPDGKLIASCFNPQSRSMTQILQPEDSTVRIWDLKSGAEVLKMNATSSRVWTIAFSPDGKTILSGGDDKIIRLWDVKTGNLVAQFPGHTDIVRRAAYSPDGKYIASASHDKTIRLWKLPNVEPIISNLGISTSPTFSQGSVGSASFNPPKSDLNFSELKPATVEIVSRPNLKLDLATFRKGDYVAPVDYVPGNPRIGTKTVSAEESYTIVEAGLKIGAIPYTDRTFRITELSEPLRGLSLVQTKMGHKGIVDGRFSLILGVDKPSFVFLALRDETLENNRQNGVPAWLHEYSATDFTLLTDNPIRGTYRVFVKPVAAGRFALGPCCCGPENASMYFAFVAQAASVSTVAVQQTDTPITATLTADANSTPTANAAPTATLQNFAYPTAPELKMSYFPRWLSIEGVQKELELTSEQIAEVSKLNTTLRSLPISERNAQSVEKIAGIISKDQMHRLNQIYWHYFGGNATRDVEVATSLGLSEDQRTRIEALGKELNLKLRASTSAGTAVSRALVDEAKETRDTKVAEILTKEQNEALIKLRGKPFDIAILDTPTVSPRPSSFPTNFVEQPTTMIRLLTMPEVQAELKLSDEIKDKVAKMNAESRKLFEAISTDFLNARGGTPNSTRTYSPEVSLRMRESLEKRMASEQTTWREICPLLTAEQTTRLVGLAIQRYSTRALVLEPVAELVGLDSEQKKIIEQANSKSSEARQSVPTRDPSLTSDARNKRTELINEAGKLIESIMTDSLRARMDSLKGANFDFPQSTRSSGPTNLLNSQSGFGSGIGTRTGMSLTGPLSTLIETATVRQELALTDDNFNTIKNFIDEKNSELATAMRSGFIFPVARDAQLTDEERKSWNELSAKFAAARQSVEAKLKESLSPEQFTRLIGLLWQREEFMALYLSEAAADSISITVEQRSQIDNIVSQFRAQPNMAVLLAGRVPSGDQAEKLLSEEQKELIEVLKGKKLGFYAGATAAAAAIDANNQATQFLNQGDFESAIEALNAAIELIPTSFVYLTNRGITKRRMGNLQSALKDFSQAIEMSSGVEYHNAFHSRAQLYMMMGETSKALEDFEAVSQKRGATAFSLYYRALALAEAGQREQAQQAFGDVAKLNQNYTSVSKYFDKPVFNRKETYDAKNVSGWSASWSPDGQQLVRGRTYFRLAEALEIVHLETGDVRLLCENGKDPVWSPLPGGPIAFVRGNSLQEQIWLVNVDGSSPRKLADGGFPSWAADGRLFYRSSKNGQNALTLDAIRIDKPEVILSSTPIVGLYPAVSSDGKLVATQGRDEQGLGTLIVKQIEDGLVVTSIERPANDTVLPSFSPDGRYVCYGTSFTGAYPGLWMLDTSSGQTFLVSGEQLTMPRWSPDGKRIAVDDRSLSKILLLNIDLSKFPTTP